MYSESQVQLPLQVEGHVGSQQKWPFSLWWMTINASQFSVGRSVIWWQERTWPEWALREWCNALWDAHWITQKVCCILLEGFILYAHPELSVSVCCQRSEHAIQKFCSPLHHGHITDGIVEQVFHSCNQKNQESSFWGKQRSIWSSSYEAFQMFEDSTSILSQFVIASQWITACGESLCKQRVPDNVISKQDTGLSGEYGESAASGRKKFYADQQSWWSITQLPAVLHQGKQWLKKYLEIASVVVWLN